MDAQQALWQIQSAGFRVQAQGGNLIVTPASQLTDAQRRLVRAHKPALLALLTKRPSTSTTSPREEQIQQVVRWLVFVGETAPDIIGEVLSNCYADPKALAYFVARAQEVPPADLADDRYPCFACGDLSATTGRCLAAARNEIPGENVTRYYRPNPTILRRCDGYKPPSVDK